MSIVVIALDLILKQDVSRCVWSHDRGHQGQKMGIGHKIVAGNAVVAAGIVIKRLMKKRKKWLS